MLRSKVIVYKGDIRSRPKRRYYHTVEWRIKEAKEMQRATIINTGRRYREVKRKI